MTKIGKKKGKPSHARYVSSNRRRANKIRHIKKNNGQGFLDRWLKAYG